nr:PD-(D/E)XK nuclease-like domain-containing protein [Rhizobium lusitanum]
MAVDIFEFQFDRLYGEDKDTDALVFGSALHARMLEGREAFLSRFCTEFDKSKHPNALVTTDDLKQWLDQHGQRGISGKRKDDLIKAALDVDPDLDILDVLKARWEKENEGKTALKPKRWAQVDVAARWVQRDPLLSAVMEDGTFIAGAPEVSVFYVDRGVRLKARFDRLLRHAIVDVKSFAPRTPGPIDGPNGSALKAINNMRYDIQSADYLRAWKYAKELHQQGLVFGDEPYGGFLAECFARDEPKWIWIMVKSTGAPQPLVIDWVAKFAKARAAEQVEAAIDSYIQLRDAYGDDQEWPPMRPAMTADDTDLPSYFGR